MGNVFIVNLSEIFISSNMFFSFFFFYRQGYKEIRFKTVYLVHSKFVVNKGEEFS